MRRSFLLVSLLTLVAIPQYAAAAPDLSKPTTPALGALLASCANEYFKLAASVVGETFDVPVVFYYSATTKKLHGQIVGGRTRSDEAKQSLQTAVGLLAVTMTYCAETYPIDPKEVAMSAIIVYNVKAAGELKPIISFNAGKYELP